MRGKMPKYYPFPMQGSRLGVGYTVGADKNETLVFVHFSAQDASILKTIIKRRS